jgi:flavodoxin I
MKILIAYASTGGSTKLVVDQVALLLSESTLPLDINKKDIVLLAPEDFSPPELIILASPTYGSGQLEPDFRKFLKLHGEQIDFSGKKVAVIGLGDAKYDADHCLESVRILEDFAKARGGELMQVPLRILKSPIPHLKTLVTKWTSDLISKLNG